MKAAAIIAIVILVIFCAIAGVYFLAGFETNEIQHLREENKQLQEQIEQLQGDLQSKSLEIQVNQAYITEQQNQIISQQAHITQLEGINQEMKDVVSMAEDVIRQNQAAFPSCPPAQFQESENLDLHPSLAAAVSSVVVLIAANAWLFRKGSLKAKSTDSNTVWVRMNRQQAAAYAKSRRRN